ncbi:MAG TPA: hypothetical protein VMK16_08130 [Acidimicrobiales bacterium]|nr:hypothetical protein [Acidimicrobiales bacterium]
MLLREAGSMPRLDLRSREYKVMLQPERFAGDDDASTDLPTWVHPNPVTKTAFVYQGR